MCCRGHYSSPKAVCEPVCPEEGGKKAPSNDSFESPKVSRFRLPSSEVSEILHLPAQDSLGLTLW